jgi:hypothetical protein
MESIDIVLHRIKNGPPDLRQKFIEDNKDFIIRAVGNVFDKSAVAKNSEEFNLGLMAFNYSIDNFNINIDRDFFIYAEKNIKKTARDALIRSAQGTSQSTGGFNENCYNKNCELSEELSLFKNDLWKFGITMEDLIASTPKSSYLIVRAVKLAKDLSNSNEFIKTISSNKIEFGFIETDSTDKKILKENSKYIIALFLIMKSKLEVIKGYIKNVNLGWNLTEYSGVILEIKGTKAVIITEDCKFLSIDKPSNSSTGNEINYKNYYSSKNKFIRRKYIILAGSAACAALFIIAGLFILKPFNNYTKQDNASYETSAKSDSGIALGSAGNDKGKEKDDKRNNNTLKNNQDSVSSESALDTDPGTNNSGNSNDNNKKADKINSRLSTPTPVNKTTPVKATDDPKTEKKQKEGRDYPNREIKPGAVKTFSTPLLVTPSIHSGSTVKPNTHTEASSQNSQVKALGEPGNVLISSDKYNVKVGDDFTITSIMTGGNNGTEWTLFENGSVSSTMKRTDYTPDSQTVMRIITAEKPGTYTYKCVFSNSFGSSESSIIHITISE